VQDGGRESWTRARCSISFHSSGEYILPTRLDSPLRFSRVGKNFLLGQEYDILRGIMCGLLADEAAALRI
jgi:hypothetical protein